MGRRDRAPSFVGFHGIRPAATGRWWPVWDLNFKTDLTAGALAENVGSLTALDGVQYHLRVANTGDESWTVTAGTGLVVDFAGGTNATARMDIKVPYFPYTSDGRYPKIRVSASFSGLVVSNAADWIGVGVGSYWRNNVTPPNPNVWCKYDVVNTTPAYQYQCQCIKGTLGDSSPSGIESAGAVASDNDADNGVIVMEDGGQGMWTGRGHSGNTGIITGDQPDTFRGQISAQAYDGQSSQKLWYTAGTSYDGPYVCLHAKNASDGSQAVTWERVIVEAYL